MQSLSQDISKCFVGHRMRSSSIDRTLDLWIAQAKVQQIDQIPNQRIRRVFTRGNLAHVHHFPGVLLDPHEHALAGLVKDHSAIKHGVRNNADKAPHLPHRRSLTQPCETTGSPGNELLANRFVALAENAEQCHLEGQAHATGQDFIFRLCIIHGPEPQIAAKVRALLDVDIKEAGFGIRFLTTGFTQIIDHGQQQLGMIFTLLMVVLDVTAENEQRAVKCCQQYILVVVGTNRNIIGEINRFLAKQGSAPELHQNEDSPKLVQVINTVLQVFTAFAVLLEALKAGFRIADGLFYFTSIDGKIIIASDSKIAGFQFKISTLANIDKYLHNISMPEGWTIRFSFIDC